MYQVVPSEFTTKFIIPRNTPINSLYPWIHLLFHCTHEIIRYFIVSKNSPINSLYPWIHLLIRCPWIHPLIHCTIYEFTRYGRHCHSYLGKIKFFWVNWITKMFQKRNFSSGWAESGPPASCRVNSLYPWIHPLIHCTHGFTC